MRYPFFITSETMKKVDRITSPQILIYEIEITWIKGN